MGTHKTIYLRSHNPMSLIIRLADGMRDWAHCGGILADGEHVIEARAFHGVIITPLSEVIKRASRYEIIEREVPDKAAGDAWALSTVGLPYDWWGAASIPWNRDWQEQDAWYCSEHDAMWRHKCGRLAFRDNTRGISPNNNYMVL